jgi:acetyl esterase/lipase
MVKFLKRLLFVFLFLLFLAVIASSFLIFRLKISVPDVIRGTGQNIVVRDIPYKSVDGRELKLDIHMPHKKIFSAAPAIFMFHGGSWDSGGKELEQDEVLDALLSFGAAVISVEYRLTDSVTIFPAHIEDCADSVRFMDAHADEYGLDNRRFCVLGASAGGQLALLLALAGENYASDSSDIGAALPITCAVSLCGPTDFLNLEGYTEEERAEVDELLMNLFGGSAEEKYELYAEASPISHVRPGACPIFIAHGTRDRIVPFFQAESFYRAAKENHMNITFIPVENADHKFRAEDGVVTPPVEEVLREMAFFLLRHLIFA